MVSGGQNGQIVPLGLVNAVVAILPFDFEFAQMDSVITKRKLIIYQIYADQSL